MVWAGSSLASLPRDTFVQTETGRRGKMRPRAQGLPFAHALARHERENAIEKTEIDFLCSDDPVFAAYIAAGEAEDWPSERAALLQLWDRDGIPEGREQFYAELKPEHSSRGGR
jgi:hypothetical protein